MWDMQQNPLLQLIEQIDGELPQGIDGAALTKCGLNAELKGKIALAYKFYSMVRHPIAISRLMILRQQDPELLRQPLIPPIAGTTTSSTSCLGMTVRMERELNFTNLISDIQHEITQNIDGAAITLLGLEAELQNNVELALGYYLSTKHPIAIAQSTLLRRNFPRILPQQQIPSHIQNASHSSTHTTALPTQSIVREFSTQPSRIRIRIESSKTQARKMLEKNFTQEDIINCISKLNKYDICFLKTLVKYNTQESYNYTIHEFAKWTGSDFETVDYYNKKLKTYGLLPRWPKISDFGNAVLKEFNDPHTTAVLGECAASARTKKFIPQQAAILKPIWQINETSAEQQVTKTRAPKRQCEDSELTLTTHTVAKEIYQEQSKAASDNDLRSAATTARVPTYTPLQQSLQEKVLPQDCNAHAEEPGYSSKEPKRITIQSLLS